MPKRIQRKRTKGWRMPENTVFVGRPGRFGNPFRVADYSNQNGLSKKSLQQFAVDDFRSALANGHLNYTECDIRRELKGKNLACWCEQGTPCHGDVLLEIANT